MFHLQKSWNIEQSVQIKVLDHRTHPPFYICKTSWVNQFVQNQWLNMNLSNLLFDHMINISCGFNFKVFVSQQLYIALFSEIVLNLFKFHMICAGSKGKQSFKHDKHYKTAGT